MRKTTFITLVLLAIVTLAGCKEKIETDITDIFVGTYSVTETWTENNKAISKPAFSMSIEKASLKSDVLLLNNFANYGAGITAEATISGYDMTIPQQTLPNLKAITGTGKTNGLTLTFKYTESFNSISIDITATAIKK